MGVVNYTIAQGRILAENRNGTRKLCRADALGSTVSLYNNSQTMTDSFTY